MDSLQNDQPAQPAQNDVNPVERDIKIIQTDEVVIDQVKDVKVKDVKVKDVKPVSAIVHIGYGNQVNRKMPSSQTLMLFELYESTLSLSSAILYILIQNSPGLNSKTDVNKIPLNEIVILVKHIDWLTYPWSKIPESVFLEIFNKLSIERLAFFCGYFKTYVYSVDFKRKEIMIDSLTQKLNKK
jgi:hypothetical protein